MAQIENGKLKVNAQTKGAELTSIYNKETGLEYLWQANPEVWGKHAPILFPVIGELKNNTFLFDGGEYTIKRHGFARESAFTLKNQEENKLTFQLTSTPATLSQYPFHFAFEVEYDLYQDSLYQTFRVYNTGDQTMYFSVGGHPAFNCPLVSEEPLTNYFLEFEKQETLQRYFLKDGLISNESETLLKDENIIPVNENLFEKDALVFKKPASKVVRLKSGQTDHGVEIDFNGFPFLGIWSKPGKSGFVCIEPWDGIADRENTNNSLTEKEGIVTLNTKEIYEKSFRITPF